jgi:hypothetical protein
LKCTITSARRRLAELEDVIVADTGYPVRYPHLAQIDAPRPDGVMAHDWSAGGVRALAVDLDIVGAHAAERRAAARRSAAAVSSGPQREG